jgi:hypothetical protein
MTQSFGTKKMRKTLSKRTLLVGGGIILLAVFVTVIYLLSTDRYTDAKIRTMQDPIVSSEKVDLTGLREIQASGGPIINFSNLKKSLHHIKKTIIIIDTMRHDHGYINNMPITFLGYHRRKLDLRYFIRRLIFTGTLQVRHQDIISEVAMAKKYGFDYKNIKIKSANSTSMTSIDKFVAYFDNIPENVWVHFHCRHGKGRTSLALAMLDIMHNAPIVTLPDIIKRQHLLGSVDLFDTVVWKTKGTYSSKALKQRKKFIEDFYDFICQRKAGGIQRWTDWRSQQQRKHKY